MKKYLFTISLIFVFGCSISPPNEKSSEEKQALAEVRRTCEFLTNSVSYYKDNRTNLCFALKYGNYGDSITNVPCSPEVEKIAHHFHSYR